jgi:hypothetical protein
MTCEEARRYLWQEPFQPVGIRLKDGRRFDIVYPRWTLAAEAFLMIGVPPEDNPGSRFPDHMIWVRWLEVEAIKPLSEPAARIPSQASDNLDFEPGKLDNPLGKVERRTIEMTCEEARQYLWRKPFQPVRIRLKDGRRYDIFYRGWTIAAEAILMIGLPPVNDPGSRFPDRKVWVRWPEVEAIEPLPEPAAPAV